MSSNTTTNTSNKGNSGSTTNVSNNNDSNSNTREGNNNGRNNPNRNNNNRRNNDNRGRNFSGNERSWEGDKPEIKGVLGLRMEWLDKKVSYRVFLEKMIDYTLREIDNPTDVLPVLKEQEDPVITFEDIHMPTDLSNEDKKSEVKVAIQNHEIKLYVTRKMELKSNMKKLYGLIKGQCSTSLRAVLKTEDDYETKDGKQDVLWLLEHVKK